ncbi:PDGLE domain-containing protein [bacterium]|nr:PDGLE domain-containing protein [bacterium]
MKRFVVVILAISLGIAGVVSWFASTRPDGLERVADDLGFITRVKDPVYSFLRDYTVPGIKGFWSNGLAGIIGVLATFGFVVLVGRIILRGKRH